MVKKENFKVLRSVADWVITFVVGVLVCSIICASALGSYSSILRTMNLALYQGWSAIGVFFAAIGFTAVVIFLMFVVGVVTRSAFIRCPRKKTTDSNSKKILHS